LLEVKDDGTLSQDMVLIQGGGSSGDYNGLAVKANNGDELFKVNNSSYHTLLPHSSAKLGIGTTSPFTPFHVSTEGAPDTSGNVTSGLVVSHGTGGNAIKIGVHDSGALNYIQSGYVNNINVARNFAIFSGAIEAMRISTSRNLFFACTSSPATAGGEGAVLESLSDGARFNIARSGTGSTLLGFYNDNGLVGTIVTSGSATQFNTSSDARLKDVTGEAKGLEVINALNPVAFNWKVDNAEDEGLLAQEVMEIVPNAVSQGEDEYYQMDYSKLVTPLIKAVQEQQEQIEQMKQEIEALKNG
jgi:hypothetical protein